MGADVRVRRGCLLDVRLPRLEVPEEGAEAMREKPLQYRKTLCKASRLGFHYLQLEARDGCDVT